MGSYNIFPIDRPEDASADLSTHQYKLVVKDSTTGYVALPTALGQRAAGVIANVPSATAHGQFAVQLGYMGIQRIAVLGAYSIGTIIYPYYSATVADNGLGCNLANAGSKPLARAITLQASTAKGDVVACLMLESVFNEQTSYGVFSSTTAGIGIPLSATQTKAFSVYADDGGAVIAAGQSVRAGIERTLVTAVHTGDMSIGGNQGQVKITSDLSGVTGHVYGLWGYCECTATASLAALTAGVLAMIDVPTSAVIASGYVAALRTGSQTLAGTHTGKAVCCAFEQPLAGAFDAWAKFGTSSGISSNAGGTLTITKKIAIYDDAGNLIYIPAGTIAGG